jgi:short-chain fatty acids transporter
VTTINEMARANTRRPGHMPINDPGETVLARLGLRFTNWAERWYPDAYVFVAAAVAVVAVAAMLNGAPAVTVARAFGDGFWSLLTFTMQAGMVVISGHVVASSVPAAKVINGLAALPRTGRAAIALMAAVAMLASMLHWGLSLIFSGLFVRALGRRVDLRMDYRAAAAAGYLGVGATWALGLSSAAAQLQANAASLPKALLDITGVIPFGQTIVLWQSLVVAAVLLIISVVLALLSAPSDAKAVTAQMMGQTIEEGQALPVLRKRPVVGGIFMGLGAALIPGGNDVLVLHGIPSLSPQAIPSYTRPNRRSSTMKVSRARCAVVSFAG